MDSRILYAGAIAAVVVERLAELWRARENSKWAFARGGREHGREHYFVMVVLHVAFLAGCLAEPWLAARTFHPAVGWPALGAALGCQGLRWWCIGTLGPRWNTRIITVPGLPLVTAGPYRWLRHPNYVAVVAEGVALPMIHDAWVTAVTFTVLNAILLGHRIRVEDAALGHRWRL